MANRLTTPDLVVLTLLTEAPMHGYQLNQELLQREVRDWAAVSRAQVYYSLKKLHEQGLITAEFDDTAAPSTGPERSIFRVLPAGSKALEKALAAPKWARQRPPEPFITWMALSFHLPAAQLKKMLDTRRKYLLSQVKKEQATLTELHQAEGAQVAVGRCMVELGIAKFETELRWLDSVEEKLLQPKAAKKRAGQAS